VVSGPPRSGRGDKADLVISLRAARERASDARDELNRAWQLGVSERADFPLDAVGDLVDAIATATKLAENTSDPELTNELAGAGTRAQRVRTIATRSREAHIIRGLLAGEKIRLLWASETVQQLTRQLEAAERHARQPGLFHPSAKRGRVTVVQGTALPPRGGFTAADLALPPGSAQPVEITLPGTFLWLAVVLLPASHRGRYHEEFRAELRDLPPNQQIDYAMRQCLQALALRRGLMAGAWAAWRTGRRTRGDQGSEGG
jgi:hypothetical protein